MKRMMLLGAVLWTMMLSVPAKALTLYLCSYSVADAWGKGIQPYRPAPFGGVVEESTKSYFGNGKILTTNSKDPRCFTNTIDGGWKIDGKILTATDLPEKSKEIYDLATRMGILEAKLEAKWMMMEKKIDTLQKSLLEAINSIDQRILNQQASQAIAVQVKEELEREFNAKIEELHSAIAELQKTR